MRSRRSYTGWIDLTKTRRGPVPTSRICAAVFTSTQALEVVSGLVEDMRVTMNGEKMQPVRPR